MVRFTDDEFDALVEDAIDSIPERFLAELDNVVFAVEDEPDDGETLGCYDGVSLLERGGSYGALETASPSSRARTSASRTTRPWWQRRSARLLSTSLATTSG